MSTVHIKIKVPNLCTKYHNILWMHISPGLPSKTRTAASSSLLSPGGWKRLLKHTYLRARPPEIEQTSQVHHLYSSSSFHWKLKMSTAYIHAYIQILTACRSNSDIHIYTYKYKYMHACILHTFIHTRKTLSNCRWIHAISFDENFVIWKNISIFLICRIGGMCIRVRTAEKEERKLILVGDTTRQYILLRPCYYWFLRHHPPY